ncbi:sugar nucleotide-binding protein [bacterium]|jgi:dTDP-4-dehydrorhamnose reductase|nr:sugar nucleotide-binding protein [bacterium]
MIVLIIGGDSLIGSALFEYWREDKTIQCYSSTRNNHLVSDSRPYIDLKKPELFKIDKHYEVVILCASISSIVSCNLNKKQTRIINVDNTYSVSKKLSQLGAHIIFLSSNQVFDGTVPFKKNNDSKSPISEYGKQKVDTEELISGLKRFSILRLTKVMHPELSLLLKWKGILENGEKISAFKDMYFSPIDIKKVIGKIDFLTKKKLVGIYHCSGCEDISYYDFAIKYVEELGYSKELVKEDFCKKKGIIPVRFTSLMSDC